MALQCIRATFELDTRPVPAHEVPDISAANALPSATTGADRKQAEALKTKGNDYLAAGKSSEAVEAYTKAIALDPHNAVYFSNRYSARTKGHQV